MPDTDPVAEIAAISEGEKSEKKKSRSTRPRQTKAEQIDLIRKGLVELFTLGAAGAQMFHRDECPQDIVRGAPAMADAWAKLAERNKRVRDALVNLVTVSDWGGVFMTTGMVVLPMLRRHGAIPDSFTVPGAPVDQVVGQPPTGPSEPIPAPKHPEPIRPGQEQEQEEDGAGGEQDRADVAPIA